MAFAGSMEVASTEQVNATTYHSHVFPMAVAPLEVTPLEKQNV